MNIDLLKTGLKKMVIAECNVKNVAISQLTDDEPIIGGGSLNLDSLDAVEIVAAVERSFGIRLENAGDSRLAFRSFTAMADYVVQKASLDSVESFVAKVQT